MKKLFACTAALALLTGACFALPASAEETTYRPGDVDLDGTVSLDDVTAILTEYTQLCVEKDPIFNSLQTILADTNEDGVVSAGDVTAALCTYMDGSVKTAQ